MAGKKKRAKLKASRKADKWLEKSNILFRCLGCGCEEKISRAVVEEFDYMGG